MEKAGCAQESEPEGNGMKKYFGILLCVCLLAFMGIAEGADFIRYMFAEDTLPNLARDDLLEVHFINVASADCMLLRMGDHAILIDSGGLREYERITKYLKTIGVDALDYVIGTHPHDDHIGGFIGVLDEVPVGTYYEPRYYEKYKSNIRTRLYRVLKRNHIPVEYLENAQQMQFGQARLTFFQWQDASIQQNNRSMMVKVEYGSRSVLLAADVEGTGQRYMAQLYGPSLQSDILKVPHHGINEYTQAFHDVVQPVFAVITSTKVKAAKSIKGLKQSEVPWVLTTKGTVVAVTEGDQWKIWQIPNPDATPGEGALEYLR